MPLTDEQRDVLKLMRSIVESYRTISIASAHGLHRLASRYFNHTVDIGPTVEAVRSRRGDLIYTEIKRLQGVIAELEKKANG